MTTSRLSPHLTRSLAALLVLLHVGVTLSFSIGKCSRHDNTRQVLLETTSGRLLGACDFVHVSDNNPRELKSGNVYSWLSVPYAEPPIRELRFKAPVQIRPRHEPIDATRLPNSCIQMNQEPPHSNSNSESTAAENTFPGFEMWQTSKSRSSEDCLYLNIWAPAEAYLKINMRNPSKPAPKLPIMVFFHGGGTTGGSAALDVYNPATFVAATSTVFITVNYRLGLFGFFYLEHYFPGNQAILDQTEALKWIRENAEKFGGDVNRVTLVGASAGAALTGYHLLHEASWSLFRNVILQSGSPLMSSLTPISKAEANKRARDVLSYAGCANQTSAQADFAYCALNSRELPKAAWEYFQDMNKHNKISQEYTMTAFPPVIDGHVISDSPNVLFRQGKKKI